MNKTRPASIRNAQKPRKTAAKHRWLQTGNGLKASITTLENADAEFARRHKKALLRQLSKMLSREFVDRERFYVATLHLQRPVHFICREENLGMIKRRLRSNHPETAVDFCTATIVGDIIQTHIFCDQEQARLLRTAIKNKTSVEAAALLHGEDDLVKSRSKSPNDPYLAGVFEGDGSL